MTIRDSEEFVRGAAGEQRVAAWLQVRGWSIIPSYDYAGPDKDKPPRLQGFKVGYAVPDLDVSREGVRRWVEVKTKWEAVLWRRTNELRHGIDLRLLQHYQTVETITGTECWIAVYEESTGALLVQAIRKLGTPSIGTDRGNKMAYWPRARFIHLHTFEVDGRCPDGP